jgi:large subunit ribosomal protein L11
LCSAGFHTLAFSVAHGYVKHISVGLHNYWRFRREIVAKKFVAVVKIQLPAGKATPAPPVGPALGQHGINIMAFVKEYNEKTANQVGNVVPAEITIYSDRSFTVKLTTPPAADMLRKAAGVPKGSSTPRRANAGNITRAQLREIAQQKMPDLNALDMEGAEKILAGTARSMGIQIVE